MNVSWTWKPFLDISGAEMHEILSVRQRVFVLEQHCFYLDADEYDRCAEHLIARASSDEVVAYARLCKPHSKYAEPSIGRVLVVQSVRGNGFGKQLIQRCIERCKAQYTAYDIRLSAQHHMQPFYREFGFCSVGSPYDDAGILHIDMVRSSSC